MRGRAWAWTGALGCLAAALGVFGCGDDDDDDSFELSEANPASVRDTTGAEFGLDCTSDHDCTLTDLPGTPQTDRCATTADGYAFWLTIGQRLGLVCQVEVEGDWGTLSPETCRPLACEQSSECPIDFGCRRGLCQTALRQTNLDDAVALCLSDVAWPADCVLYQVPDEIYRIADECEYACTVPSTCRQP